MNQSLITGKRDRYLWYLYDFANSIALITLLYYFSLWAVVDNQMSQWIVSLPVSLSTLTLIFIMPKIARKVDENGNHKKMMLLFSVGAAAALLILAFLKQSEHLALIVFVVYFLFYLCFQSGYIFFTSFLSEITNESNGVKTSGFGQLWGQFGNLVGVLLSFGTLGLTLFGIIGKQQTFLWGAMVFLLLLIPFYWFRKGVPTIKRHSEVGEFNPSLFKKVWNNKKIFWFLVMYIFYADAMMTISFFVTLYLTKGPSFSPESIKIAGLCMLVGTIIGGLLTARLQKYDQLKSIKNLLVVWPLLILLVAFLSNPIWIAVLLVFVGIVFSMIFATCRSYYSTLIPFEERAEYFSIYVIFERMGAVLGPIAWSSVISIFMFMGESFAYRAAMVSTAIITLGSLLVFRKVQARESTSKDKVNN